MAASGGSQEHVVDDPTPGTPADEPTAAVSTHSTDPGRTLFVEKDNADGWIATDVTVAPDR
jgi:hypothetical protein